MNVVAVVVAGGTRTPGAPDALTELAGVPMVVRTVRAVLASGVADHVALRGGDRLPEMLRACAGLPVHPWRPGGADRVVAHAGQRDDAPDGDDADAGSLVLVHDAVRPLTPARLFRVVLDAVRSAHRAVVPVLPLADTVKTVDDAGLLRTTPDRSGLRVVQTPHAFRGPDLHFGPPGAGTSTVPGDPLAFAVRTPWDLELAELLLEFGP